MAGGTEAQVQRFCRQCAADRLAPGPDAQLARSHQLQPVPPNIFMTLGWKSPINNRWLMEASLAHNSSNYDQRRHTR